MSSINRLASNRRGFTPDGQVIVIRKAKTPQESRRMRRTLMEATAGAPRHVTIDLRQIDDISHQAFAALVGVRSRQIAKQRRLTLVCAPRSVTERVLARSGLRESLTIGSHLLAELPRSPEGGR